MNERFNKTYLLVILGIYIITFLAISRNLFTPYLWFDEADQFWISKGLNPDSDPLTKENGIIEVIENNKYYNMDPGGYGVLLHIWSYASNHHVWLRLLSFSFFFGIVLSFIYLSYLWLKDIHVALLMGFMPILTTVVLYMAFEIRAYSMESLGTMISVVALEKLKNKMTYKRLFLELFILPFCDIPLFRNYRNLYCFSLYFVFNL